MNSFNKNIKFSIGQAIKKKRKLCKISITSFCSENNIAISALLKIESGKLNTSVLKLNKIIEKFNA